MRVLWEDFVLLVKIFLFEKNLLVCMFFYFKIFWFELWIMLLLIGLFDNEWIRCS